MLLSGAVLTMVLSGAAPALGQPVANRGCPPAFEDYDLREQLAIAAELGVPESEVLAGIERYDRNGDTVLCFQFHKGGVPNIIENSTAHG